jgi:hypothetical protein
MKSQAIQLGGRSVALFLSFSLIFNPSYALAVLNRTATTHFSPAAELFGSEALTQALIEAWHGELSFSPKAVVRRTRELGRVVRAHQSRTDGLTLNQMLHLERAALKFGLNEADKMYLRELWRQRLHPDPNKKPLRIGADETQGGNFILASELTENQRRQWLGAVPYAELAADPQNAAAAKYISITFNSLDGGIGENVGRLEWLRARVRSQDPNADVSDVKMGAKGTDLGYDILLNHERVFVSIAEVRLLQLIELARRKKFGEILIQPLVNEQSRESYEKLFNSVFLFDRIGNNTPYLKPSTYRQTFEKVGIKFPASGAMLMQADLPGIEQETGLVTLDQGGLRQPGGHGQWGVAFLWRAYREALPDDWRRHIRFFSNGDNVNGRVSESIAGYMTRNNIPIIKLTTAATPIDKKGGKDGVRKTVVNGQVVYVPDQMELADAKAAKQVEEFYAAGQSGDDAKRQPFNTNIIYLNTSLLHPILADLADVIGEDQLARVISPVLIKKDPKNVGGKNYVPWDGAIGVAVHNLNAYFLTSTDPRVQGVLKNHRVDRLLRFVDVPRDFFAPVKSTFDIWWQRYSDFYKFHKVRLTLDQADPKAAPPEVDLSSPRQGDPKKDDGFWNELQNLVNAFGSASTRWLESLKIVGQVHLKDAILKGHISILNETGRLIDMRSLEFRQALVSLFTSEGKLLLEDVSIVFHANGQVEHRLGSAA